jgi:hypothetical protein
MKTLLKLRNVEFPAPSDLNVNMMPFVMGDHGSIPELARAYCPLIDACDLERSQIGKIGFLSITETFVATGKSQRRPGIHTEKHANKGWGGGWGRGRYENNRRHGGLYLASTVDRSCRAWDMHIETTGHMGNCEHLRSTLASRRSVITQSNTLYWMTDSCPHESLPLQAGMFRQWFRLVTHEVDLWYEKHSTTNPLGVIPTCEIIKANKFA